MTELTFEMKVKKIIDELKALCTAYGLGNTGEEYKVISQAFTYKFLNDKLLYKLKEDFVYEKGMTIVDFLDSIDDEDFDDCLDFMGGDTASFHKEHFISKLSLRRNEEDFHKTLDNVFIEVAELNEDIFSIQTSGGKKKKLFEKLVTKSVADSDKRQQFAKELIEILESESFEAMFSQKHDFFSVIFEYLIADYNKDSGKYAEYFTPAFCGRLVADILIGDEDVKDVSCYDPSAGSGTLLMTLSHKIGEDKCSIYSQDISQKSSDFLRLNLMLNDMVHSLSHIKQGDTLVEPAHKDGSKLKQFDYIVSNPPFKVDFSKSVEQLSSDVYDRFFAGVPSVPKTKKDSMAIYLMFMQHVLASLSDTGKACIIVPSGFCTDSSKIALEIRKKMIDNNWLRGVIQMPSNIFSNTGTNVSCIFVDKTKTDEDVILVDASSLGKKIKTSSGQKTDLSKEELDKIKETFINRVDVDDFSKKVSNHKLKENDYQINAGRYFDIKFENLMSTEELDKKLQELMSGLKVKFEESNRLQEEVLKQLGGIKYEEIKGC